MKDDPVSLYILQSQSNKRYHIGVTSNVSRRLRQHNAGVTKATQGKGPWEVVYTENYPTRRAARRREAALKRKKSHHYLTWFISKQ